MHILTPTFAALLLALPPLTLSAPISPTALSSLTTSPFSKSSKLISTSQLHPYKPSKSYKTSTSNTFLDLDDALASPTLSTKHRTLSQNADGGEDVADRDPTEAVNPASWDDYSYTYKYNGADGSSTSTVRSNALPGLLEGADSDEAASVVAVGGGNRNRREEAQGFDLDTDELVNSAISGERKGKGKKVGDVLRGWLPSARKGQGLGRVVEETTVEVVGEEERVGGGYDRKVPGLGRFVEETGDTLEDMRMGEEDGGYDSMEVEVGDGGFVWSDDEDGQAGMGYVSDGGYSAGSEGFASDGGSDGFGSDGGYYSEGGESGSEGYSDGGHSEGSGSEDNGCTTGSSNKIPAEYI